jgi:hypothetical protein
MKEVIHSLLAAEEGKWPATDRHHQAYNQEPFCSKCGQDLCGGYFGVLWNFRADAEYKANYLQMPGHWSSAHPCVGCPANKIDGDPMHYLNFTAANAWMDNVFLDMDVYRAHCDAKGKPVCLLLAKREHGGLGAHLLIMLHDTLHCIDLGPAQHVAGSTLWLLTYGSYVCDGEPQKALDTVCDQIQKLYAENKTHVRFTNIRLDMFTDEAAPLASNPEMRSKRS